MEIKPIHNEKDHAAALAEIARLMERELTGAEEDRLEVLTTLADAWEREHHALGRVTDPVRALEAHMAMTGKTQTDLAELLGSRSRASEILNRRTPLSMSALRKLRDAWGLPADVLLGEASIVAEKPAAYRTRTKKRAGRAARKKR